MLARVLFFVFVTCGSAAAFELGLPISCTLGTDCFIQQYVDRDLGPDARDYACGAETYDGHKGIDIRLRTTADVEKGIAVLAAAQGVIAGVRDGMADHLIRSEEDRAAIAGHECGNGVRIDHGQGWQTQYCHMRQGSLTVKKGDHVAAGTKLGEVGYSGDAAFPHIHFQVTNKDEVVDPFLPDPKAPCGTGGQALWAGSANSALAYQRGSLLAVGLSDHVITVGELEVGAPLATPYRTPIVAYLWAINLQRGDLVAIELNNEGQMVASNSKMLERNKAQFMLLVGRRVPSQGWPEGTYTAIAKVTRGGVEVINESKSISLKPQL